MRAVLRQVDDHGHEYTALMFVCPGCAQMMSGGSGIHMLPVAGDTNGRPSWGWDGNLDAPTLTPSILTRSTWKGVEVACHSFLQGGVFDFLTDSTHALAGQKVPMPDLPPEWATD